MIFLQTIDILWLFHTYKDREYNTEWHKSIDNVKPEWQKDIFLMTYFIWCYNAIKNIFFNDIFQCRIYGWSIGFVPMSLCLSFVIISMGYLGDYSPPFGGGARGRGQLVGQALLLILSFLYRVPTIILWIFFLFSFFLFNFVPIIKEIRTINRMILRTKHLLNWPTQSYCLS